MTKRTRAHQLETESIHAFTRIIPPHWVYRTLASDYGIDGMVEIFDEDGNATGALFLVQLKGTDQVEAKKAFSITLKTSTGQYYKNILLPVLIVRYVSKTETIYARFFEKNTPIPNSQKTFTYSLTENDKWNMDAPNHILNKVSFFNGAVEIGIREKLIEQYYKTDLLERQHIYKLTQDNAPALKKGCRVMHAVFGKGIVEEITDNYLFVKFDDDKFSKKFLPVSFGEFHIL